jgi:hypothetical protein
MPSETSEEFRCRSSRNFWPREFTKRREFNRRDENEPYISYVECVQALSDDEDEYEDEDEGEGEEGEDEEDNEDCSYKNEDEDELDRKSDQPRAKDGNKDDAPIEENQVEEYKRYNKVRTFMLGIEGDDEKLHSRDQVEKVAGFYERAMNVAPRPNTKTGKAVALLDDMSSHSTIVAKHGSCRPYLGGLNSQDLGKELRKNVGYNLLVSPEIDRNSHITAF